MTKTALITGLQDCLYLGNLDAIRDWGHARYFRPTEVETLLGDATKAMGYHE